MTMQAAATIRRPHDERRRDETRRLFAAAAVAPSPEERERLLEEVVLVNIGLARSLAGRFRNRGVPLEDLEQIASLTLVRIVRTFDPGKDRDFLAYAVPSIRGDLKRYFRDHAWTVRPPRRVQEIQLEVQRAHARARELGEPANAERIAEDLQLKPTDVHEALLADGCFSPLSLDSPLSADAGAFSLGDTIESSDDGRRDAAEARVLLEPVLRQLTERERRIVRLRYAEGRTQREIADELGVTQMQVSRLLTRILRRLREGVGADASGVA